jgi:glycosyltransferase involved in cell wall biosynthesis
LYRTQLSIIIPTFNQAAALDLTLHWFTRVLPKRSEIIVIDDGSEEDIRSVVDRYRIDCPIQYCKTARKGRAAARNLGAKLSEGERILFNDSDRFPGNIDLTAHGDGTGILIGKIMEFYFSQPEEMMERLKFELESVQSKARMPYYPRIIRKYLYDSEGRQDTNVPWLGFLSGHVSVPREAFNDVGGFDENFIEWGVEHFELGYRLAQSEVSFTQIHAENYHIAHPRPNHFYYANLRNSFNYFKLKHHDHTIQMFEQFMFGSASLQDVERASNKESRCRWLQLTEEPVMMPPL